MDAIWDGFTEALRLIFTGDEALFEIALRTILVSGTATILAMAAGVPLGYAVARSRFPGRTLVLGAVNTGMGIPPVVVGLVVWLLLVRSGPFGDLDLIYTKQAMVIAQFVIALPLVVGFTAAAVQALPPSLPDLLAVLGAGPVRRLWLVAREAQLGILVAVMAGFGAVASEVGASMTVGGNLQDETRVLTTAIVTETSRGQNANAMAYGIILLAMAFVVNVVLTFVQQRRGGLMDVRVEGLRFLRGPRTVLDIPSLAFASGATTALVGPNGSGKSTLLRLISALEKPAAGCVWLGDVKVKPGAAVRERVAYAFQSAVFISGSVGQNLDLALELRRVPAAERPARSTEAAEACGIAHLLGRSARALSGGEAQRANLARALCLRAPVTLLDEPLSGLDGPARRQLLHDLPGILRAFATTTIVVTHDRDEALRLADDIAVLIDGRIRATGSRAEVFGSPPDPESAAFLGYSIIPADAGLVAIAPRALRVGPGERTFELRVEEVLDFGVRREAWGTIAGVRVSVGLPAGDAAVSDTLVVSAPANAVRVFGGDEVEPS